MREGPNGQIVSINRAADVRRQRSRKIIDKERKKQGQKRILGEHLDGLERKGFCDFDKPRKRAYQNEKIESNEQSKEKDGMPDRVKGFREINNREDCTRSRSEFVKSIRNGPRNKKNLI